MYSDHGDQREQTNWLPSVSLQVTAEGSQGEVGGGAVWGVVLFQEHIHTKVPAPGKEVWVGAHPSYDLGGESTRILSAAKPLCLK